MGFLQVAGNEAANVLGERDTQLSRSIARSALSLRIKGNLGT